MHLDAYPSWPLFHLATAAADRVKGIAANGPRPRDSTRVTRVWNSHEVAPMFCMFTPRFRGGKHSTANEVVATAKVKWESVE